ncbi:MAG: hypothetical protein ABI442_04495 [Gemmatimonadaceae bacterium]
MEVLSCVRTTGLRTSLTMSPVARVRRSVALAVAFIAIGGTSARAAAPPPATWRVTTLEHVDLWLHGFALLTSDTGRVPFFQRGYKVQINSLKKQKNAFTLLDANAHDLSARFATNPALANAQFVAMYFPSMQEIVNATDLFIRSNGDPRAARDQQMYQELAILAANFPSPADRNWLRLYVASLQDESAKFYHAYWNAEQARRTAAFQAVQEQWASKYYPKLSRFLNNTQQEGGQLVLSLPLGGEGRTVNDGKQNNIVAVEYPEKPELATDAIFAFIHEAMAKIVDEVINDNSSPADKRTGALAGYVGNGAVRGGALLVQRIAPELVPDYMRYYERTMGMTAPKGDLQNLFETAFPLPDNILAAISKQIDILLGGI